VRLTAPLEPIYLDIDRAIHLGLIVNELVTNALKHAFPDGTPGEMGVDVRADEERLEVSVWDRGRGLPPTLDVHSAGTLGLKIVRILTERLGAILTVENAPGAIFTLTVPLSAAPAA
jgi:two-component sensor histidine kinase